MIERPQCSTMALCAQEKTALLFSLMAEDGELAGIMDPSREHLATMIGKLYLPLTPTSPPSPHPIPWVIGLC